MKQDTHDFWANWLVVVALVTASMGALFALTPLGGGAVAMMSEWSGLSTPPPNAAWENLIAFSLGLTGALMMGWCLLLAGIAHHAFRQGESWAWKTIAVSVITWFVVDSYISASTGFYANVVGNIVFLILFEIPLVATFNSMVRRPLTRQGATA